MEGQGAKRIYKKYKTPQEWFFLVAQYHLNCLLDLFEISF